MTTSLFNTALTLTADPKINAFFALLEEDMDAQRDRAPRFTKERIEDFMATRANFAKLGAAVDHLLLSCRSVTGAGDRRALLSLRSVIAQIRGTKRPARISKRAKTMAAIARTCGSLFEVEYRTVRGREQARVVGTVTWRSTNPDSSYNRMRAEQNYGPLDRRLGLVRIGYAPSKAARKAPANPFRAKKLTYVAVIKQAKSAR